MFEKIYLLEKFSEKHFFPQKVPQETLSPVLIALLTFFRQKSVFSTKFKKKNPTPRPPPVLKRIIKLNIYPGTFSSEKLIRTDEDTILTICF